MKAKLLVLILLLTGAAAAQGTLTQAEPPMLVYDFTDLLVKALGLEKQLPADIDSQSREKACEIRRDLLVAHGLLPLKDKDCDNCVDRALLVETVYQLVYQKLGLTADNFDDKLKALVEREFIKPGPLHECFSECDTLLTFSHRFFLEEKVFFLPPTKRPGVTLTLREFMEMLIPALGLETKLPPDLDKYPDKKICDIEAAVLMNHGFPYFQGQDCEQCAQLGQLGDVLYELIYRKLGLCELSEQEAKLDQLEEKDYLEGGSPNRCLLECEARRILEQPFFRDAATAYSKLPPYLGSNPDDPIVDLLGSYRIKNVTEEPASPILPSKKK